MGDDGFPFNGLNMGGGGFLGGQIKCGKKTGGFFRFQFCWLKKSAKIRLIYDIVEGNVSL